MYCLMDLRSLVFSLLTTHVVAQLLELALISYQHILGSDNNSMNDSNNFGIN